MLYQLSYLGISLKPQAAWERGFIVSRDGCVHHATPSATRGAATRQAEAERARRSPLGRRRATTQGSAKRPKIHDYCYSPSSSSSFPPGMVYDPDNQRFRSTSRQRSEQKGFEASRAGLPQIGHFLADRLAAALPEPARLGGLAGIQPAEADRKTLAAEQRDRFIDRQSDAVGVGPDYLEHHPSRDVP